MKMFVATQQTQGTRANDFTQCDEGVIVTFPAFECDGESVDGKCGCKRSLIGIVGGATTTFKVVDAPEMDAERYESLVLQHFRDGGWLARNDEGEGDDPEAVEAVRAEHVRPMLALAAKFPAGLVLEKRGGKFQSRSTKTREEVKALCFAHVKAWVDARPGLTPAQLRKYASGQWAKARRSRDPQTVRDHELQAESFDELALAMESGK